MKKIYVMVLCACSSLTCWAQQAEEVSNIKALRSQPTSTSVVLTMDCDTVLTTVDGGICLNDGARIRLEGIDLKPTSIVSGTLIGTLGEWKGYPSLLVSQEDSRYQILGNLPWSVTIDLEGYEKMAKGTGGEYVNPWKEVPDDPRTGFVTVSDIAELKMQAPDTEVRLVLTYDTVLFAGNGDMYVRDGNVRGAINFKGMNLRLEEGMVLLGSVVGRLVMVDDKAQFVATENTTDKYYIVTEKMAYTTPYYDLDEEGQDYVDDVVVTGEVMIDSLEDDAGTRRLYAYKQTNGARLLLNDKYDFCSQSIVVPAKCATLKGILSVGNSGSELYVLTDIGTVSESTRIKKTSREATTDNTPRYNLSGQRVSPVYKGVVVNREGRKYIISR